MSSALHPRRRGQSLVELALMLPVLGILLIGTIDFARVYYAAMAIDQAARAGAAYGAQSVAKSGDDAGMAQAALSAANLDLTPAVTAANAHATHRCACADGTQVSCTTGTCTEGVPRVCVSVEIDRTFQTLFPYPGIPTTVRLNRTATMRVQ